MRRAVTGVLSVDLEWCGGQEGGADRLGLTRLVQFKSAPDTWVSHWRAWCKLAKWCLDERRQGRPLCIFPLSVFDGARALRFELDRARSVSAATAFRAGVNAVHAFHNEQSPFPAGRGLSFSLMQAAKRLLGRPVHQKLRLTVDIVRAVVAIYVRRNSDEWELVVAMFIVLQVATFNRWSDMTMIRTDAMLVRRRGVPGITNMSGYDLACATGVTTVCIFLAGSKTDRTWKGRWQAIGATGHSTCPVRLLQKVLLRRGRTAGWLIRPIHRRGAWQRGPGGIREFRPTFGSVKTKCGKSQYPIYRDLYLKALVAVSRGTMTVQRAASFWGTHSGRVTGQSLAAQRGVRGWLRRKQGGYGSGPASVRVADGYIQDLEMQAGISLQMGL